MRTPAPRAQPCGPFRPRVGYLHAQIDRLPKLDQFAALVLHEAPKTVQTPPGQLLDRPDSRELHGFVLPKQAAERLGVNRETIYRLCARGELPHVWIGAALASTSARTLLVKEPCLASKHSKRSFTFIVD